MGRQELALLWMEVRRRILSSRYAVLVAMLVYLVWGMVGQMRAYHATTGFAYNAWDVFLGVFGGTASPIVPAVVLPMLFVAILGGSVQQDVVSGLHLLVQSRMEHRNRYWWVKVAAAFVVIALTVTLLLVLSVGLGAAAGLAVVPPSLSAAGGHPAAWTIAAGVPPAYYSLPPGTDIVRHDLAVAGYMTFAYFSVVVFVIGVTVRARSTYTPLAVGLLVVAMGLAMLFAASPVIGRLSLASALIESSHRPIPVIDTGTDYVVPWLYSVAVLTGLMLCGLVVGTVLTPTRTPRGGGGVGPFARRIAAPTACVAMVAWCALLTGCAPPGFGEPDIPKVPRVRVARLSESDRAYARRVASQTVLLGNAVVGLNAVWDPAYLHVPDAEIDALLADRVAVIRRELDAARALEPPAALRDWHDRQYAPGLDELEYVTDDLVRLNARRDPVAVWMCLKHVERANAYLSVAGQTLEAAAGER